MLGISLRKLEFSTAVARHRSVTRAADELFVAQPVVSGHIRSIEQRIGIRLFDRSHRQMELTDAGMLFQEWALDVLASMRELERTIDGLSSGVLGSVAIAATMTAATFLIPDVLIDFKRAHPKVHISLNATEIETVLADTEAGRCDFGLLMSDGLISNRSIEQEIIRNEDIVLVAPPTGLVGPSLELAQLGDLSFVCSPVDRRRRQLIDRVLARQGLPKRNVVLGLGEAFAIKQAVRKRVGVALLFRSSAAADIAAGTLREVKILDADLSVPVVLVHARNRPLSPLQARLAELVRLRLAGVNYSQLKSA